MRVLCIGEPDRSVIVLVIKRGAISSDINPLVATDLRMTLDYGLLVEIVLKPESVSLNRTYEITQLDLRLIQGSSQR